MDTRFGFGTVVGTSFDETIENVTAALKTEGFGVLTDIDVAATMKAKLDKDMPPYRILGACNPSLAHQAISAEPEIGLLLPCNVVVRALPDGKTRVSFMDPESVLQLVDQPGVEILAADVKARLHRVMAAVSAS
ncbi:MAG: DUF302 domain-containing protein [Armatimonadaceae bacterium]